MSYPSKPSPSEETVGCFGLFVASWIGFTLGYAVAIILLNNALCSHAGYKHAEFFSAYPICYNDAEKVDLVPIQPSK